MKFDSLFTGILSIGPIINYLDNLGSQHRVGGSLGYYYHMQSTPLQGHNRKTGRNDIGNGSLHQRILDNMDGMGRAPELVPFHHIHLKLKKNPHILMILVMHAVRIYFNCVEVHTLCNNTMTRHCFLAKNLDSQQWSPNQGYF